MREPLFDIVFFGILQPGKDKNTVMDNMAKLFKTDTARITAYFSGGRKVIKSQVNAGTAEKYISALENVGLKVKLEDATDDTVRTQAKSAIPATSDDLVTDSSTTNNPGPENHIQIPADAILAPVGANMAIHLQAVPAQKITDFSSITLATTGADVLAHPVEKPAQKIADINNISMAETGSDILLQPQIVTPQIINDFSFLSMADIGVDIIENPSMKKTVTINDFSELTLKED